MVSLDDDFWDRIEWDRSITRSSLVGTCKGKWHREIVFGNILWFLRLILIFSSHGNFQTLFQNQKSIQLIWHKLNALHRTYSGWPIRDLHIFSQMRSNISEFWILHIKIYLFYHQISQIQFWKRFSGKFQIIIFLHGYANTEFCNFLVEIFC